MFVFALGLFTLASMLCAAAPTLTALVAARVLQCNAGGLMMPVAMAMIYELFAPHERGRALGYFGIAVMAPPAIGPVLGGSVVSSAGWRWLFLINVPIGLVGLPVAIFLLRDTGFREARPAGPHRSPPQRYRHRCPAHRRRAGRFGRLAEPDRARLGGARRRPPRHVRPACADLAQPPHRNPHLRQSSLRHRHDHHRPAGRRPVQPPRLHPPRAGVSFGASPSSGSG